MALYRLLEHQTGFGYTGLSVKELIIDFQDGGHLGYPIRTFLATFVLQITSILPIKFRVNWPFCSDVQNRFSRWRFWRPS